MVGVVNPAPAITWPLALVVIVAVAVSCAILILAIIVGFIHNSTELTILPFGTLTKSSTPSNITAPEPQRLLSAVHPDPATASYAVVLEKPVRVPLQLVPHDPPLTAVAVDGVSLKFHWAIRDVWDIGVSPSAVRIPNIPN